MAMKSCAVSKYSILSKLEARSEFSGSDIGSSNLPQITGLSTSVPLSA